MDLNTITEISRPGAASELPLWRVGDAWLGGGTWLFSEPQNGLSRLIDLAGLGWPPLEWTAAHLTIGATCTLAQLAAADLPPLFGQCCRALLGSFKVWNAATVGGNLCMALPAGPMAALLTALDGVCRIWTCDGAEHRLPVPEFIRGPQLTALQPGELLRAVELPLAALQRRTAYRQISLTPLGRSAALLIGALIPDGGFTLTVTASIRRPLRLAFPALPSADALHDALAAAIPAEHYYDDLHGAPDWRRHMTLRLAEDVRQDLAA